MLIAKANATNHALVQSKIFSKMMLGKSALMLVTISFAVMVLVIAAVVPRNLELQNATTFFEN